MIAAIYTQLKPELLTLGAALLILLVDLVQVRGSRRWIGWLSAALALGLVVQTLQQFARKDLAPGFPPVELWGGVVVVDRLGSLFKTIFLLGVAIVSVGSVDFAAQRFRHLGEYYALLFFSALGMMLMASAGDLI
ncbi:MAG: hypothetical protein MUQ56_09995, partial [Thermoleophilia bacterium]|nr:hypothetical protein [Thermoleophilia bacterium]